MKPRSVSERLLLIVLAAIAMFCGSAPGSWAGPKRKPKPPRIVAHLDAIPPVTISGRMVTLVAWLDDPEASVKCPSITWSWPDGTRSSHTGDCDPDEVVTRHQEIKRGALPQGEHEFSVRFASAGKEWQASVVVPVL